MFISLIIPVFNCERFLPKLFNCIRNQLHKHFEVIFVDDGSVDDTHKLLEGFKKTYDGEVKIITIKNSGSNPARKIGIDNAKYDHIVFADGDDEFDKNYLMTFIINYENGIDILSSSCFVKNDKNESIVKKDVALDAPIVISRENDILKRLYSYNGICDYYWNKLFNKIVFDGVDMSNRLPFEELRTVHKIFENAKKIKIIDEPHYFYIQREDSQSARKPLINYYKYEARKERYLYTIENYVDNDLVNLISYRLVDDYIDFAQDESWRMWKKDHSFIKDIYLSNKMFINKDRRLKKHIKFLLAAPRLYKLIYLIKHWI